MQPDTEGIGLSLSCGFQEAQVALKGRNYVLSRHIVQFNSTVSLLTSALMHVFDDNICPVLLFFSPPLATVEFRSSMDGSICPQEPSMKTSMVLPTKKSVSFPNDHQETPAKPPLYHKQPPALPPKPFSRIPNHSTGQSNVSLGFAALIISLPRHLIMTRQA